MPLADKPATISAPEVPTVTPRRRKIVPIAVSVVVAGAALWLYVDEVAKNVEMTIPPAPRTGGDFAQVKPALLQERDKADKLARELNADLAQAKQALQQERDKTDKLARELNADRAQAKQALQQREEQSKALQESLA